MKKIFTIISILLCISVFGQTNDEVLTNASVVNLYSKGLSTSIIVSKIKTSKSNFDVSTDALIKLKDQKIPDDIVNAMVEASGNKDNNVGDINDPNASHESGIYYLKKTNDKTEMFAIEPTVVAQIKSGSGIGSALTYGIASTKNKAKLDGGMAHLQMEENQPSFYFYFDKGSNLNNSTTYFSPTSSPNEFVLVKTDASKKSREFEIGKANNWSGVSSGIPDKDKVPFDVEKIKSGVYKVTPKKPLKVGEYCFMYAGSATSNGATGKVYDFGIQIIKK